MDEHYIDEKAEKAHTHNWNFSNCGFYAFSTMTDPTGHHAQWHCNQNGNSCFGFGFDFIFNLDPPEKNWERTKKKQCKTSEYEIK